MNSFLLNLQKNAFYVLIPVVLFFSFSTAYLLRTIILIFLNPAKIETKKNTFLTSSNQTPPKAVSIYEDMVEGNMIRGKKYIEPAPGTMANGAPAPMIEPDPPGADELMVTGTVAGQSWFARVAIKEKDREESDEYAIGRKVAGYIVKQIADHYAVLSKNGLNLKVEVGETIKEAKERYAAIMATKSTSKPEDGNYVQGQKIIRVISRTDFEKFLQNEADIYKNARFGPNMVDGKIDGYKIYQVSPSHIFAQLGAKNGDIIRRVNGVPLNNTQKMLELWSNIKNSTTITIDIERKGVNITYEFQIRN